MIITAEIILLSQTATDCKFLFFTFPIDYSCYSWSGIGCKDVSRIHEIMQQLKIWEIARVVIPDFSRNRISKWLILLRLKLLTWLPEMCISHFLWHKSIYSSSQILNFVKNSFYCIHIQPFEVVSEIHLPKSRSELFQTSELQNHYHENFCYVLKRSQTRSNEV